MAKFPAKVEMEDEKELDLEPIPEKYLPLLNEVARHQMNISDAYFSMACYHKEGKDTDTPFILIFIEDQALVKWSQAKQTLKYIAARKSRICVPDIQRPVFDNRGAGIQGLVSVLEMEKELTKCLENLSTSASENGDSHLLKFTKAYLIKQKRNEDYLVREIAYQKPDKEQAQQAQEESVFKKPAPVPIKKTPCGSKIQLLTTSSKLKVFIDSLV